MAPAGAVSNLDDALMEEIDDEGLSLNVEDEMLAELERLAVQLPSPNGSTATDSSVQDSTEVVSVDSKARFKVIGPPPLLKAPPLPKSEDGIPELVRRNSIPPLPESDKKGGSSTQTPGRDDEAGSQAGTGVTDEDARDTAEEGQKKIEQIDAKWEAMEKRKQDRKQKELEALEQAEKQKEDEENALPEGTVPLFFYHVIKSEYFDKTILFFIIVTCIQLASFDPTDMSTTSVRAQVDYAVDLVLLIVFTVEMIMKLIALGVCRYCKDGWNRLDGFVVIMGYVTMAPEMDKLVVMRLLRVFRPLRIINKLEGMKAIVKTLAMSAAGLRDTCVLCIFIFFMFGIVGDTLFGGVLRHKCFKQVGTGNATAWEEDPAIERMCGGHFSCPGSHRCMFADANPNFDTTSFDNIAVGFLTIFVAITLEGWVDVMYQVQDGYSYAGATLYFHVLVIVGSLFAVNLALAVISDCFDQTLVSDDDAELTEEEMETRIEEEVAEGLLGGAGEGQVQNTITVRRRLKRMSVSEPRGKVLKPAKVQDRMFHTCRRCFRIVSESTIFTNFMFWAIIGNTIVLALEHSPTETVTIQTPNGPVYQQRATQMDATLNDFCEIMNAVFVTIFASEMLIKILGDGLANYWADSFNRFDGFVVITSLVELVAASSGSFTALRAFRLMRIFKVARSWKAMQTIMRCILETLPSMGYLCVILMLFMFIMAVAGMFLFGDKLKPPALEEKPRANFDNFGWAMLSVFQILSGENWNEILYNGVEATGPSAVLYFLLLVCIGSFIVLNLTLAILLSNFDEGDYGEDDMVTIQDIKDFLSYYLPIFRKSTSVVVPEETLHQTPHDDAIETGQAVGAMGDGAVATPRKYSVAEDEQAQGVGGTQLTQEEVSSSGAGQSLSSSGAGQGSGVGKEATPNEPEVAKVDGDTPLTWSPVNAKVDLDGTNGDMDKELDEALDHVKGKMCSSMMGGIKEVKAKADVAHYFHQMKINFQYRDPAMEVSVFHTSMAVALKHYNEASYKKQSLRDAEKDCTGLIPGEAPVLNERSLYCFAADSSCRKQLAYIVVHPVFENMILFLIVASSITLAMDQPGLQKGSDLYNILETFDQIFTFVFTVELMLKVIVYGLIFTKTAYLKDVWNILDAFIVTISLISVFAGDSAGSLRSLRTLRALRPLRTIKRAPGLRCVVEAIIRCIPPFVNIAMVSTVFYLIFAILGVQFWAGKFWSCTDPSVAGADECWGTFEEDVHGDGVITNSTREWKNAPIHFDDVQQGMLTLFEVASLELWLDVMYNAMDVPDYLGQQPVKNSSPWYAVYFVIFIVIGAFLILNLFVGAVVDTFTLVKNEQNRIATMTPAQAEFVSSLRLMMLKRPQAALLPPPEDAQFYTLQMWCYNIVRYDFKGEKSGSVFDSVVIGLIIVNVIVMSLVIFEKPAKGTLVGTVDVMKAQDTEWNWAISTVNVLFTVLFSMEACLKLVGLGCKQYFSSKMNFFDFFVVTISIAGDILDRSIAQYNMSFVNMLLIFRAARVMRIFRLFTRFKGVRRLLETLLYTLPSLLNVTTLLVMVLFIYTILGMSFFGTMPLCPEGPCPYGLYNHHANFRYFYTGFFTLFRMSTGESWNGIMHDCTAVYGGKASFFFVSYMVIGSSLMFNLVIAILLDEFSSMGASDSYEVTPDAITKFGEHWQALDPSGSYVIPAKKLVALLRSVEPPLGVGPNGNAAEAHLMLLKVNAPLNAGHAHFVETFVALVRFAYKVDHLDQVLYNNVVAQLVNMFPALATPSDLIASEGGGVFEDVPSPPCSPTSPQAKEDIAS